MIHGTILQGDFTYDGTEQFKPGNRFKFFPTISAAWVVSNESFLKDTDWLSFLKIRASAGWLGNDQIQYRFLYATDVRYKDAGYLLSNYYGFHTVKVCKVIRISIMKNLPAKLRNRYYLIQLTRYHI